MGHRPPGMVLRGGLGEPDIARVARELARLARARDRIAVADLAACRVDEVGAALHLADQVGVEEVLGLGMQGRVDRDDVADAHQRLGARVVRDVELLLDRGREAVPIGVVQPDLEWLQPPQHGPADATGADRADLHALQVVGPRHAVGDVPATVDDPPMGRDVVPHEGEDHHHHVLGHADAVAVRHLGDGDRALDRRLEIDVIRADPRRHRQLEVRRLGDPLRGQICRPERLRDHDLGVRKLSLEDRIGSVLVGRHDQPVAALLQEPAQPELARDAAEQLTRREVDPLRARRRLAVVVPLDLGNVVACVGRRIAADGIVVEHTENVRHAVTLLDLCGPAATASS